MKSISIKFVAVFALLSFNLINAQEKTASIDNTLKSYLSVSAALIKSDSNEASKNAATFLEALRSLEKSPLQPAERKAVEATLPELKRTASEIESGKDLKTQREAFKSLSSTMFSLAKALPHQEPIYYNNCPMAKGNWLSIEKAIRNPYYGSQMLTCGKTIETLN